ncbi:MAG TPA: ferritin-like domain-containing protein [Acidimicrobiales bacterium]|nr:ferritin-like domain-containing protein [Acidimicrobiales bacterium]
MRSTEAFVSQQCESVPVSFPAVFSWDYTHDDRRLVRLYDKAKRSQWNAATDIDWSLEVDPLRSDAATVEMLRDAPGSPFAHLGDDELAEIGWESQAWTVSQFLHGEQGALLAAAKIVDTVPDEDAKLYAATQVMDEARHVEVYARYLADKLERTYPINRHLGALLQDLLTDSRWDMTYLGMQIMVESLALAAFGFIYQTTQEPLLREITSHVMADEARHVAFGIASLSGLYDDMPAHERHDREEFVCEAAELMRDRFLQREVWERLGLPVDQCEQFVRDNPLQRQFRSMLFSKVVPNVKRIGLLTPYVRQQFERLGVLEYESLPASA